MSKESKTLLSEFRLDPDEGEIFDLEAPAKPWKKVALAIVLLLLGTVFLATGLGLYLSGKENGVPLLVIGCVAFLPGFYHTRIAYYAWKGYRGFSLSSIPDF